MHIEARFMLQFQSLPEASTAFKITSDHLGGDHELTFYFRQIVRLAIELETLPPPIEVSNGEISLLAEALTKRAEKSDNTWEHAQVSKMLDSLPAAPGLIQ